MSEPALTLTAGPPRAAARLLDYVALCKPRVVSMVLVTTLVGYYLGAAGRFDLHLAVSLLLGTALAAGGTLALNQYMERDLDAKMMRTCGRPLPNGRMRPVEALVVGTVNTILGTVYLWIGVNALTALLTAAITVTYLFLYTPLKRRSPLCSVVGAVPGALPPVAGWAAAQNSLGLEPWILFAIMFLWQLPHSLAIAQLYQDDYARAGIRLLPIERPGTGATERQIVANSAALLLVGLLPTVLGYAGMTYLAVAAVLGAAMLAFGVKLMRQPTENAARRVMFASLVYLPLLLLALALDRA